MRRRCAMLACAVIGNAAAAQVVIQGPQTSLAPHTIVNQDVIIRNVTFPLVMLGTFQVTVTNGTITVEGISGPGTDGANGVANTPCNSDGMFAGYGGPGMNVVLKSLPAVGDPHPRALGVHVVGVIDVHGGKGGNGAAGTDEFPGMNCSTCPPTHGRAGGNGGDGGSVEIVCPQDVNIDLNAVIITSGGDGGDGGNAGAGTSGAPSNAGTGGNGGNAKLVYVNHKLVGNTGTVELFGDIVAQGGNAGKGGNGGTGPGGTTAGAAGGDGGSGDQVEINGGDIAVKGRIFAKGGCGGRAGAGGSSPIPGFLCLLCEDGSWIQICTPAITAADAGAAGAGSNGGNVLFNATNNLTCAQRPDGGCPTFYATGGNGGAGNIGGVGSFGFADCPDCKASESPDHINECPAVAKSGSPSAGARGGDGGLTSLAAGRFFNLTPLGLHTTGGCGGNGGRGNDAHCVPMVTDGTPRVRVCNAVPAIMGAAGGAGGDGGSINLSAALAISTAPYYALSGGDGGAGGPGGDGFDCASWLEPWAAGGIGANAGGGGTYTATGQPSYTTFVPVSSCSPQAPHPTLPNRYKGPDGAQGTSNVGCTCGES